MTLELKKFDMKHISFRPDENKGPVVVLIGRRDTGKSYLVRDLLFYHQDIPIGTVISGTEAGSARYFEKSRMAAPVTSRQAVLTSSNCLLESSRGRMDTSTVSSGVQPGRSSESSMAFRVGSFSR